MICPHCRVRLLRKERTGRTCHGCRKEFALDPKLDSLSDLRIHHLVGHLTEQGRYRCTADQLRHALEPRRSRSADDWLPAPADPIKWAVAGGFFGASGTLLLVTAEAAAPYVAGGAALALAAPLSAVAVRRRRRNARRTVVRRAVVPGWTAPAFAAVLARWTAVYGELPAGVVIDAEVAPSRPVGAPVAALLCPDAAARACLHANGFPERHRTLLVASAADVPDGLPVVVLHDDSVPGLLLAAQVRAALPGRTVVDAGLPPGTALRERRTVQLRDVGLDPELLARLADAPGLTDAQRARYADGWWSPLAAVRPGVLLAAAERAVHRAAARHATPVGFLTWPEEGTA
ncbi:hypothetical protein ACWGB8_25685 [Kitasatospora sp. NPDC054939]